MKKPPLHPARPALGAVSAEVSPANAEGSGGGTGVVSTAPGAAGGGGTLVSAAPGAAGGDAAPGGGLAGAGWAPASSAAAVNPMPSSTERTILMRRDSPR